MKRVHHVVIKICGECRRWGCRNCPSPERWGFEGFQLPSKPWGHCRWVHSIVQHSRNAIQESWTTCQSSIRWSSLLRSRRVPGYWIFPIPLASHARFVNLEFTNENFRKIVMEFLIRHKIEEIGPEMDKKAFLINFIKYFIVRCSLCNSTIFEQWDQEIQHFFIHLNQSWNFHLRMWR